MKSNRFERSLRNGVLAVIAAVVPTAQAVTTCPTEYAPDKCRIVVTVKLTTTGKCKVTSNEDDLNIKVSAGKTDMPMIWVLKDENSTRTDFQFCPSTGDGAFLKEPEYADRQMSEMGSAKNDDTLDPNPALDCKRRFRFKNKNGNALTYDYQLRFQDTKSGVQCFIDPWIKNGQ